MDIGNLIGKAILDISDWMSGADRAMSAISDLSAAAAAVGAATAAGIGAMAGIGVEVASNADRATTALGVMMKDTEAAGALMADIRQMAAATPFESGDLVAGAQSLMSMGFAASEVIPTLTALGDAAAAAPAGMQAALPLIVKAFGQIRAKGKVSMEELYQLGENGVGAIGMIAESLGVTVAEAMDRVSSGGLDAATGLNALMQGIERDLGGMMAKQSQTLDGVLSTLSDTFKVALGDMAAPLVDSLTRAVPAVSQLAGAMVAGLGPFIQIMTQAVDRAAGMIEAFNQTNASAQAMGATGVASVGLLIGALGAVVYSANAATAAVGTLAAAVGGLEAVAAPILAIGAAVGVVGGAFYALYSAIGAEGEGPLDFLSRMGGVLLDEVRPAIDAVQQAGAAFLAGFGVGLGDLTPLIASIGKTLADTLASAMNLIGELIGAGNGWQAWYQLGAIMGSLAKTLATTMTDALNTGTRMVRSMHAVFGPLLASLAELVRGLFDLLSAATKVGNAYRRMTTDLAGGFNDLKGGATDLLSAFKRTAYGISGAIISVVAGVVTASLALISQLAGGLGMLLDAIPGVASTGIGESLAGVADALTSTAQGMADSLVAKVVRGVEGSTFNMEVNGMVAPDMGGTFNMEAAASAAGFNMEMDAAASGVGRYGNALAGLTAQTEAATKSAKGADSAAKAVKPPDIDALAAQFATQYDPVASPVIDFLRGFYADLEKADTGADLAALRADLAVAMGRYSLTIEQIAAAEEAIGGKIAAETSGIGATIGAAAAQAADDLQTAFRERLASAAAGAGDILMTALGDVGTVIKAGVEGFKTGGAAGAAVAAVGAMLAQTESFQNLIANVNTAFAGMLTALDPLVQGIGMVVMPVMDLVSALLGGLAPVFKTLGGVLGMFAPALSALGGALAGIGMILEVSMKIIEPVMPILEMSFRILFNVLKVVSLIVMAVALAIGTAWNAVLETISRVISGISRALGGIDALDELTRSIQSQKVDTAGMAEAMADLASTTYDQAYANASAASSTAMMAEAAADATEALTNVPSGYKVALARFNATAAATSAGSAAQMGRGGGGSAVNIENVTVIANDPEALLEQIEGIANKRAYRYSGVGAVYAVQNRYTGRGA